MVFLSIGFVNRIRIDVFLTTLLSAFAGTEREYEGRLVTIGIINISLRDVLTFTSVTGFFTSVNSITEAGSSFDL